jgi:hypothetical protein
MIKYLEVPDFHFSKAWADTARDCAASVQQAAIENKVDFIAVPGDFFDAPIFASDKGGMDIAQKIMKMWTDIVPVAAIEGTPSHDSPGCYGLFDGMNFTLLKPGKVYGYDQNTCKIVEGEGADCILFGIPELNKSNIQAKLSLSAEAANAEAVNLFGQYIDEFVGPMRSKYENVPAVGLLHGVVSERRQENSDNLVVRVSDIIITTDILRQANLDRWTLGHLHHPREFDSICAGYSGYPGIDHNPWGKRDFIPEFNMVEISTAFGAPIDIDISRFPYGTPMRIKTNNPEEIVSDKNIAYWLETEDPNIEFILNGKNTFPDQYGIHHWSRITYTEQTIETRRVTKEQAAIAKTLWDMFKLIDPEVSTNLKGKIDSIPTPRNSIAINKLDAVLTSVEVSGCDLFGGRSVNFNLKELANGMNQLIGSNGNGDGKSSLLGMCSLYPCVVGKDTKSGRRSALKDFFSGQDSMIIKTAIVNGQKHNHKITIKGAHTQNPKTECYLDIDGIPQLEKATFDTMMEKCEELYGNYEDYLLTTFYEQPQQSRNQRSGLMTATMTEARNLVQNIAGIDRESEKRYALDQVSDCEKTEQQLTSDINAMEKYSENIEELNLEFANKGSEIVSKNNNLGKVKTKGTKTKQKAEALQVKHTENEKLKTKKAEVEKNIVFVENAINHSKDRIKELNKTVKDLPCNQVSIKQDDEAKKLETDYSTLLLSYTTIINGYNNQIIEQNTYKKDQQTIIDNAEVTKQSHNREIELISEPCENCGYIKLDIQEKISSLNNSITLLDESIKMSFDNINSLIDIVKPEIIEPIKPAESLSSFDREIIQDAITEGLKAETEIEGLEAGIIKDQELMKSYNKDLAGIVIDDKIEFLLKITEKFLDNIRNLYSKISKTISTLEAEKKAIADKIEKAKKEEKELKTKKENLSVSEANHTDWTYIAKMLNPDKIPALELDIILDSIDAEATRNIEPFLEGRYSFHTETQSQGKKTTVDKFDVLIHDAESGLSFSMFYTNPGNKAFYSDCYIKALIRKRNERQQRSYSPIIYDEADGPVNPIRVKAYYDIQQAYFKTEKVLIVSQKDISASYVEKVFNIEEMKS